ncbi:MAG: hypothetical protein WC728_17865 [Elusimicrobiota bacterium]
MASPDPEQDIPELSGKEKRRESKGAGIVFGQSGVAGVGTTNLVPAPLVQAGKMLLAAGGATGAAQPTVLKAVLSFAAAKLPMLMAVVLTSATVVGLYRTIRPHASVAPKQSTPFRAGLKPLEEPQFGGGGETASNDSLGYLIAGNQSSDSTRDSISLNQNLMEAAMLPGEAEETPPAATRPNAAPSPEDAAVPQEKKAPDAGAKDPAKAAVADPGSTLASGIGLWKGITRKFDSNSEFSLGRDRILAGAAAAFKEQKSPYHGRLSSNSSSRTGGSSVLNQLFSSHQKSRSALGQSSGEGKAATAGQAFGGSPRAQSGRIRPSAKRGDGAESAPMTFDTNDGGPISTPFSGKAPAPSLGNTDDVSPWTSDIERAHDKLTDASSLITVIGILAPFKMIPIVGPIVMMVQGILYSMALSYSSTAMDIGNSVQSDWAQPQQSDIVTTGSGITDAAAAAALAAPVSMTAWASVLAGVAGIAALVAVLLATKQ